MSDQEWDVVVIGGSAAGLSAGLMLGRSRRRTLVVDSGSPRNRFAEHIHGVLGNEGASPAQLLERGRAEAAGYGVEFADDLVERVDEVECGVEVTLRQGERMRARAVIIATGVSDELPNIPGLAERWGTSVLHCPYCHGWEVADRRIGVLATSPMSLHQAQLVRQWSDDVTVFTAGLGPLDMTAEFRLRARGIRLVASPVVEVLGDGPRMSGVRTADGAVIELDAIFTGGTLRPNDGVVEHLGLTRAETPSGTFIEADFAGKTSAQRIWAAGNVTSPMANLPLSIGAGAMAGSAVNMFLVTEDFDRAVAERTDWADVAPDEYWQHRYGGPAEVWSGRVNHVLAAVAGTLTPGRALDLGCGEGADVIWLAEHGWTATGVDISASAIERARRAAAAAGVEVALVAADLTTFGDDERYDLVSASYLHSPVQLARTSILRAAARRVAPGGHLLITSHSAFATSGALAASLGGRLSSPQEEVAELGLAPGEWEVLVAEVRPREGAAGEGHGAAHAEQADHDPHAGHEQHAGHHGHTDDSVVLLRRR